MRANRGSGPTTTGRPARATLAALLSVTISACHGWRSELAPQPQAPRQLGSRDNPSVRIFLKSGAEFYLVLPKVEGDSLVGYTREGRPEFARQAVVLSDIRKIETYGFDGAKTALAVVAILGATAGLVIACVSSLNNI